MDDDGVTLGVLVGVASDGVANEAVLDTDGGGAAAAPDHGTRGAGIDACDERPEWSR